MNDGAGRIGELDQDLAAAKGDLESADRRVAELEHAAGRPPRTRFGRRRQLRRLGIPLVQVPPLGPTVTAADGTTYERRNDR